MKLSTIPPNARIVWDPALSPTLSRLRDQSLHPSDVRALIAQITAILAKDAVIPPSPDEQVAIIVILRSGLAMMESFVSQLPKNADMIICHLGLFREKESLQPVEYYNKLAPKSPKIKHGYILDPIIATGGTASAAINILKDWGLEKITFLSILASDSGLDRAARVSPESVQFVVGAVDPGLDSRGYVQPGLGDIGDRLFGTAT